MGEIKTTADLKILVAVYNGQKVQDLDIEEVSSDRRNPILADVMAQLDYMEKRGSGLKRICNETRSLESYKEDRKPKFKSSSSHFITTIYSMEYDPEGTKQSSSSNQVSTSNSTSSSTSNGTSNSTSDKLLRLVRVVRGEMSIKEIMAELGMKSRPMFLNNYLTPAIKAGLVEMTQPNSPNSPTQRYVLTEEGRKLLE